MLVDPFSTATEALLNRLDQLAPGIPIVGGVASWASAPGRNRLVLDGEISNAGFVGVTLHGNVRVSTIVSQGCRPVGDWFTVTSSRSNLIQELDGSLRSRFFSKSLPRLAPTTRNSCAPASCSGVASPRSPTIWATAPSSSASSWARTGIRRHQRGRPRARGEYVQFHVRDAQSARDDLELLLTPQVFEETAAGALLFTCNGRGERFFGERDADVEIIGSALGEQVPVAGFFCGGEIGPIGSTSFVHGYTASLAVFRPAANAAPSAEG